MRTTNNNNGFNRIVHQALTQLPHLSIWRFRFMQTLFATVLLIQGKINYSSLSRHSPYSERSYRRWFKRDFPFERFNRACIEQVYEDEGQWVAVIDASFINKSGKKTEGLGKFYSGTLGYSKKGLELSLIALIERNSKQSYALSGKQSVPKADETKYERYAQHLRETAPHLPSSLKYLLFDADYSKKPFVDAVRELGLHGIGRLRCDANLKYLYEGTYSGRGRPKLYDGKVKYDDLSRFEKLGELDKDCEVYTKVVWHVSLEQKIRVVLLKKTKGKCLGKHALLFSTDTDICGWEVLRLYRLRFQIEMNQAQCTYTSSALYLRAA